MTPSARLQAAIELLDEIVDAAAGAGAAADTLIARYFKTRRYAGAKDRRAVRELVFRAVRRAGPRPGSGRAALLGLKEQRPLFDGSPHGPA
ncbi:MAG: RsmB/NOP family class I SAM-dependent RNA methyltransferase, partial [Allosphingosinicella sp.]